MIKSVTRERDRELRSRYDDLRNSGINPRYYSWKVVAHLIAQQKAPRFYISPKKAEQYVFGFYKGAYKGVHAAKSIIKRAMIVDLVENYEVLKNKYPDRKSWEIFEMLVNCQAKSFYISERTIQYIIYEYLRPSANRSHKN